MKIRELLNGGKRTVSFEFFPPKDDAGFDELFANITKLEPLGPSYVSVTYGAGGGTRRKTVDLVKRIRQQTGIEAMAHLTCVGSTREEIAEVLDDLERGGIENVLPLRGDPPKGQEKFTAVNGGFRYASELIEFIRTRYDFSLGGACYPESHPEAPSPHSDLDNLKRKVDAGADFLITQLFFDNRDFFCFRDRVRAAGIEVPLIAGIMPIRNVKQIKRFTQMCGARIPDELLDKIEAVEDDPESVNAIGVHHAIRQCEELLRDGVQGLHFYTLNRSSATRAIFQEIKALI